MMMALDGIRVIDWTQWQMGPSASSMLGDLGADVIKIEHPVSGDGGRGIMTVNQVMNQVGGRNFFFEFNNRNKRGITLDVSKPRGKEILFRLVKKSDVFIQNYRFGVSKKLGIDYESLSKINPRLIYANATGFGTKGKDAIKPAYDALAIARSGFMTMHGEPNTPPLVTVGAIADQMGAIMTAYGVLGALMARERHGVGQEVEVSLLSSMMWLQHNNVASKLMLGQELSRSYRNKAGNPLYNYYQCSDGKWLMLANLQPDRQWPILCKALNIMELQNDPKFSSIEGRGKNAEELIRILDRSFATKTRDEWLKILEQSGDIICGPINTVSDMVEDPQILANEYIIEYDHPVFGITKVVNVPIKYSRTPGGIKRPAPEFGQHTEEILVDLLEYTWDDIAAFKDERII